ncbi:MAG: BACON domain-containing protein [Bacteroidales bacterium]|nr:BACON domain-containing protein [Bacteroidales bacterium]
MRIKHLILFLAAAALFVPSCKKEEPVEPQITVTTQSVPDISDEGGSFTVSFSSSLDWTATKDANWLSVNPASGVAGENCTITVTAQPNTGYDPRSGKVTITCGDETKASQTITVNQKQKGALVLTQTNYVIGCEGETITVQVKANSNVTATVDGQAENWIIPLDTKGLVDSEFSFEIKPNETYDERSSFITFSNEAGSEKVTITQKQKGAIIVTENTFSVSYEGGTVSVKVKANVEVSCSIAEDAAEWISLVTSKGLTENDYTFEVLENETYVERTGIITFSSEAGSEQVTITQEAAPEPVVNEGVKIFNAAGLVQFAQAYNNLEYAQEENLDVTLAADIVFDAATSEAFNATGGIGTKDGETSNYFHGVFDGAGFTISGLQATVPLFAYIGTEGTVKNLNLASDCSFTLTHPNDADAHFGSVVGYHKGKLENVQSAAAVSLSAVPTSPQVDSVHFSTMLGGLVGRATTGEISNCGYSGAISVPDGFVTDSTLFIGGVLGYFSNTGSMTASSFNGTILNEARVANANKNKPYLAVGGFVGYNSAGTVSQCETTDHPTIAGSYSETYGTIVNKTVVSYNSAIGGIVGENHAVISNCVNKAQVLTTIFKDGNADGSARYLRIGGIAGRNMSGGSITDCRNEGIVATRSNPRLHSIGGIVGWNEAEAVVSGCSNKANLSIGTTGVGSYSARLPYFGGVIGENYSSAISDVQNYGELLVSRTENNTGTEVRMGGVIGCNYAALNGGSYRNIANYGKVYFNTNLSKQAIRYSIGGVVGYSKASVEGALNCGYVLFNWNSNANIAKLAHLGGIVGYLDGVEGESYVISNCVNSVAEGNDNGGEVYLNVKSGSAGHTQDYVGGILGYSTANVAISNCTNLGYIHGGNATKVNGTSCYVGGIVAYLTGISSVSDCTNSGNAYNNHSSNSTGNNNTAFNGGIAGWVTGTEQNPITISNCIQTTSDLSPRRGYSGGVVGYADYASISDCNVSVNFGGSAYYVGGIAGWLLNSTVSGCNVTGTGIETTQMQYGGGIVAKLDAGSTLDNCSTKITTFSGTTEEANFKACGAVAGLSASGSTIKNCHYPAEGTINGGGTTHTWTMCPDSNFTDGGGNVADL